MKTLETWMLALALPLLALTPACDDKDDDDSGDDAATDSGNDGGPADSGNNDSGAPADSGNNDSGAPADSGNADSGAPADSGNADSGPSGGDVGDQCTSDADCADDACLFAGDVDYGFCSKVCDSFADCPDFWDCGPVGNASADYCIPPE